MTQNAVVSRLNDAGVTTMIGAITPSEVMAARRLDADVVKIFPASLGGPGYLRSLRGPFPDLPLMPTGGVNVDNLADWYAAGAVAVGAGGELCSSAAMAAGDWAGIEQTARRFSDAYAALRAR
jgi:2-dehydro-3-deoxyphosphogluconate aldolase/(4S)-4-hydroxy-2-oxoglutarate aldolase